MNIQITDDTGQQISVIDVSIGAVSSVNGHTGAITLTAADIGADATGTAASAVAAHVAATDPHGDRAFATSLVQAGVTDWVNVQKSPYNALGNGTGNDATAIQAAINAASAQGGGIVYIPAGTYNIASTLTVPSKVILVGAGRHVTILEKTAAGVLVSMSGPATDPSGATHVRYSGIQQIDLNGNGLAGALLRCYYSDNHTFRDVFFTSNADVCVDAVEFWDSRFYNCQFESSGGAANSTTPNVWLRNSAAASGFGYSADTTNQIAFDLCRWESFYNGALRIEQGTSNTNNPNGIYVINCKMETSLMRGGPHLHVQDACRDVIATGLYCYAGGFYSGYSTAQNIINWAPQASVLEDVLIANGAVATINAAIDLYSGTGTSVLRNVVGQYSTAPTGSHVYIEASAGDFRFENVYSNTGAQFGGTAPAKHISSPLRGVAGAVTDGAFTVAPLDGTAAIDTTNSQMYMRVGGAWIPVGQSVPADMTAGGNLIASTAGKGLRVKEGTNAKMGTAALVGGTKAVATTAVTATSRIYITSNADGGTPGWLRVSARTAGTSFTIQSSSATDTSTIAWMIVEPA